uniref:3-ketoacyl-[acyl-carrier-protein] reductase beta subunit n=1 Tax=Tetraodon nigroviridis TaxID=99883 RepID=H3DJX6_TETNG
MSRLAVVCGGSRGVGKAVARLLAQRGCRVAVVLRGGALDSFLLWPLGAEHMALSCDVSKEEEVQQTFESIQKTAGNISYLVNAAGINRPVNISAGAAEQMFSHTAKNLSGFYLVTLLTFIQQMCAVSFAGSVVGLKGNAGQCVYSASKSGLEGFTRSLAKEVASRDIRVNLVAPGFIRTDMTAGLKEADGARSIPLGRFGEPEEVAQAVFFLLQSPYITGQVLVVDGGLQLAT